jgi:superfamily II DNA or RNA helicase
MADNDMDPSQKECDYFHDALDYGLKIIGKGEISLKAKQYEVVKSVVLARKVVLCVLPTGYGKSIIILVIYWQILHAPVLDFFSVGCTPTITNKLY